MGYKRCEVLASSNILQYMCDFIHVLIFVIISKCRKNSKSTNIVIDTTHSSTQVTKTPYPETSQFHNGYSDAHASLSHAYTKPWRYVLIIMLVSNTHLQLSCVWLGVDPRTDTTKDIMYLGGVGWGVLYDHSIRKITFPLIINKIFA